MKFDYKQIIDEILSRNFWSRMFITVICVFILAINYNIFLFNNNLVIGGTSGIATILNAYCGIEPATVIFIFNTILIIISFFLLSPKQTGLTIIGSFLYPLFISLTSDICKLIAEKIILDNFILIVLVSGTLFGIANGFIYKTGFSTGGGDIIIQLVTKYLKIPTGTASLITNGIIIICGGIIFGLSSTIYAILIVIINSVLIDKIMLGISDSKMFYIYTTKTLEVKQLIKEMNSGFTIMKTIGGYTNEENDLIMCVISTRDYYMFKNVIEKIDPKAFLIISDCYGVYGGQRKEKIPFI